MRTFAALAAVFFAVTIIGALFCLGMTMLFIYATQLVVGEVSPGIPFDVILFYFFLWLGICAALSCIFTIAYTIRYPGNVLSRTVSHTILCTAAWFLVLPACILGTIHFSPAQFPTPKAESAKYFRLAEGVTYYYSKTTGPAKTASGVLIDTSTPKSGADGLLEMEEMPLIQNDIVPFSDTLIHNTLIIAKPGKLLTQASVAIYGTARAAFSGGLLPWLAFSSWGFALYSLIGLRRVFSWRLLNFGLVSLCFAGICLLNGYYCTGWDGTIFGTLTIPHWTMNAVIGVAFCCLGSILAIFRADPNMERDL